MLVNFFNTFINMRTGLIKILAEKQGLTIVKLSNLVGVSEQQMHRLVKTGSTKVETLEKIALALNVSASVFFDDNYNPNVVNEPGASYNSKNLDYKKAFDVCKIEKAALENQIIELKKLLLK